MKKQKGLVVVKTVSAAIVAYAIIATSVSKINVAIELPTIEAKEQSDTNTPFVYENRSQAMSDTNENELSDPCRLKVVVCDSEKLYATRITSYNADEAQTDADPNTMASGKKVYQGAIANNCLAFGTKVRIEGLGVFTVEDRMNKRYGCDVFDIFQTKPQNNVAIINKRIAYTIIK